MRIRGVFLALAFAGNALAATPRDVVQQAVQKIAPSAKVDEAQESAVPGFYEAIIGGQMLYVSKDGRYLLDGSAFDVANQRDLSEESRARARKLALDKIGPDKRIVFAPKAPVKARHTITVLTDIDCPYCRRFHDQIAQYNAKGIVVDYLFNPLSIHPGADKKAQAVWCAKDRAETFTAAMSGKDPGTATCPNPINELANLAQSLGLTQTPTFLGPDGKQIPGQIAASPDLLAAELDRQSAAVNSRN